MGYEVGVETIVEVRPLAVVRRCARPEQFSKVVPECCGVVWSTLKAHGVKGAGRHVAVYWDDVVNLEVGVEMEGEFSGCGEVVRSALPVGVVVRTIHLGPYQKLGEAQAGVRGWCAGNGCAVDGATGEMWGGAVGGWSWG